MDTQTRIPLLVTAVALTALVAVLALWQQVDASGCASFGAETVCESPTAGP